MDDGPAPKRPRSGSGGRERDAKRATRPAAKTYPFELDDFQKEAVGYLERGESVLVSAHTSAGKTAVAEYAIAMAFRDKQRVIYTSPIKALSNQKYRDLQEEFDDVGLMTGDVTIAPNASVLVMTTEILRSMLYRGSEILREVAWVVFDEVHYMRDRERGVVWEESIILLPHKVRYVFLSATIPNGQEFVNWVARVHRQPCHIVYTEKRPTPLQHYLFPAGADGLFLTVDENRTFKSDQFQKAMAEMIGDESAAAAQMAKRTGGKSADLERVVQMVMERGYDPVIVFSFSKRDCENYAEKIAKASGASFNEPEAAALVESVYRSAIASLSEEDRNLPQVTTLLPVLKCGVGIHHGGLLPLLKEVVEILFGEGLLKILFATETFAMGINMPAKTVIFTSNRKFDGTDFRLVGPGEYIQMSGRAGRRGKDDRGVVIQMVDKKMDEGEARVMMAGQAAPLLSTFHLGYNMVLNLLRVEDADPEFMVRNSLHMFQREQRAPALLARANALEAQANASFDAGGPAAHDALQAYHAVTLDVMRVKRLLQNASVPYLNRFLKPGRLVVSQKHGLGILKTPPVVSALDRVRIVQAMCFDDGDTGDDGRDDALRSRDIPMTDLAAVTQLMVNLPNNFMSSKVLAGLGRQLREIERRFATAPNGIPVLDPVKDLKMPKPDDDEAKRALEAVADTHAKMSKLTSNAPAMATVERHYPAYLQRLKLERAASRMRAEAEEATTLPLKRQLERMKQVLRDLQHITEEDVVTLKGKVACEISTADELLATELLLAGVFNALSPPEVAALVSCLVATDKSVSDDVDPGKLPPTLKQSYKTLVEIATRLAEVQRELFADEDAKRAGVEDDDGGGGVEERQRAYVEKFRCDLMEVVYRWCDGAPFSAICELTDAFEGSVIRVIRRQVELMRQLASACHVVGDFELEEKFNLAVEGLRRDIVFAASLYLT